MNRRAFLGAMAATPVAIRGLVAPLPFLMYPQAEEAGERRDSLEPEQFKYTITAREM